VSRNLRVPTAVGKVSLSNADQLLVGVRQEEASVRGDKNILFQADLPVLVGTNVEFDCKDVSLLDYPLGALAELGWFPLASGFLPLELPRTVRMPKDAVAIAVQGQGDAFAFDDDPQETEVAVAVLLLAEERPRDRPRGASSTAKSNVIRGPLSSNQSWSLPSICTSIPSCGSRSRRTR